MKYKEVTKPPAGFLYFPNFITAEEEATLIKNFSAFEWQEVKMHGIVAKRKVMHFGFDYTYESRSITPTIKPPAFLKNIINRSAFLLKTTADEIAEVLISKYMIDAGIGWHRDAPIFGERVFGISLGAIATIKLRLKENTLVYKTELAPRSAYILSGAARLKWEHCIPPVKNERYSITLRTLKKQNSNK